MQVGFELLCVELRLGEATYSAAVERTRQRALWEAEARAAEAKVAEARAAEEARAAQAEAEAEAEAAAAEAVAVAAAEAVALAAAVQTLASPRRSCARPRSSVRPDCD